MYDDHNSDGGSPLPDKHVLDMLPEAPKTPIIYMPEVPTHKIDLKESSAKTEKRIAVEVRRKGGSLKYQ